MAQVTQEQMKSRTKQFAIRIIRLYRALPKTEEARVIGKQLLSWTLAIQGAKSRVG